MSQDTNLGQFKNAADADAAAAQNGWAALCAKHGQTEAITAKSSGTVSELHNSRKALRRAINAIYAALKPHEFDNQVTESLSYASQMVASCSHGIDLMERVKENTPSGGLNILRNRADFDKHYHTERGQMRGDESEFGISDFLKGVAGLRSNGAVQNALSVGTDSTGGYSVPTVLMPGILGAMVPVSSLLTAGAGFIALEAGGKNYTIAAVDTIPAAAWRAEAGALAVSDPAFRAVTITPRSLAFTFKVSRELLADGQGIEAALMQAIAQSFAKELDRVGLRGTGTAPEPRGLLNLSGIQSVTNGAAGTVLASYANLFTGTQALLEANAPMPTAAIMSPRSLIKLG